jgi:hypothetical protein
MNRTMLTLALMLLASSAAALERSPSQRGTSDGGDRHADSDRGGQVSGGDRDRGHDRSLGQRSGGKSGKSYPQRDRSGRAGDRD